LTAVSGKNMKKLLFPAILSFLFFFTACEKKTDKVLEPNGMAADPSAGPDVTEDTLDEFEYEADSVETDDDEDL
jgi:hypothetical protein